MAKYVTQEGIQLVIDDYKNRLDVKADKSALTNFATKADLDNIEIPEVNLSNYATKNDVAAAVAAVEYDDTALAARVTTLEGGLEGVYHFKGSKADLATLTSEVQNPEVGDAYNLVDTGMNVAWNGEAWDEFGSTVDLSGYALKSEVEALTKAEINALLFSGKSAVVANVDSLAAMMANNQNEVEITLNDDIEIKENFVVPAGKSVVLDLGENEIEVDNGKYFVVQGDVELKGGAVAGTAYPVLVQEGGTLTIDGTDITATNDCAVSVTGANAEVVVNNGTITSQEVPVIVTSGGKAVINGGHLVGLDNFAIGGNGSGGKGDIEVVINGGIIEGKIQSANYTAAAIYWPNTGTLTINGGTIISEGAGIVQRGGTINLNSGTTVTANGPAGFTGKVGDSRVVVGSYAIVYDKYSEYPAYQTMELNIAEDVVLTGTDGDIQVIPADATGINDNRPQPQPEEPAGE